MQRLGSEMTALTYALMTDDYETVTRSTVAIIRNGGADFAGGDSEWQDAQTVCTVCLPRASLAA